MNQKQFTPGPWTAVETKAGKWKAVDQNGFSIATTPDYGESAKANATIIAAAPLMYQAMIRFLPIIESLEKNEPDMWDFLTQGTGIATANSYREAIKKATVPPLAK